jgi:hypothetical protein
MGLENYFNNFKKSKSLDKDFDEKMFSLMYVLLDYSYPGEIEENVEEIVRVLKDSYEHNIKLNPKLSKEYISEMIYNQKLQDYHQIALIIKNEREN